MTDRQSELEDAGRRSFMARAIVAIHAVMGAALAFILGATTLTPSFARRRESWLRAAALDALPDDQPLAVTLRVMRQDGYSQVIDRTVVYLVRTGDDGVRALQSTCTHLGCRTSYDRRSKRILCPCHGGVFDTMGNVIDGPPPAPLPTLATRIEDGHVLVQMQA